MSNTIKSAFTESDLKLLNDFYDELNFFTQKRRTISFSIIIPISILIIVVSHQAQSIFGLIIASALLVVGCGLTDYHNDYIPLKKIVVLNSFCSLYKSENSEILMNLLHEVTITEHKSFLSVVIHKHIVDIVRLKGGLKNLLENSWKRKNNTEIRNMILSANKR